MSSPLSLSVVVPCFDEEGRIVESLRLLCQTLAEQAPSAWEVVVVDDHSTDRTAALVREYCDGCPQVRLVRSDAGKGKGAAVRTGVLAAVHDAVLVIDADLAGDLAAIPALCARLAVADAVLGSRLLPGAVVDPPRSMSRRCAAWVFRAAVRVITPLRVSDPQCGCKVFRREVVQTHIARVTTNGYAYEIELLLRLQAAGAVLAELPIRWHEGLDSKVRVANDGVRMLRDVWTIRRRVGSTGGPQPRPIGEE